MRSEVEVTPRLHEVGTVVLVARLDVHEYLDLDQGLRVEALLVPYDLDGHHALLLVVEGLDHLAKRPFAQDADDLVAVEYMVVRDDGIVTSLVVVPWVGSGSGLGLGVGSVRRTL